MMRRVRNIILTMMLDISLVAVVIGGDYFYSYKMPHKLSAAYLQTPTKNQLQATNENREMQIDTQESVSLYKDMTTDTSHFSDCVISTDTQYKSSDISIEITSSSYDSAVIDPSENGKHKKYGSKIAYTVADIYVSDVTLLKTAFAQDTYGIGYAESLADMSQRVQSVLAVNGDSYSNNRHKNNGTIIRNGMVYRAKPSTEETCVLFRDGTMKIYTPDTFQADEVIQQGAWQSWVFGPSLLDEAGNAKKDFLTWDYIKESHPRTAIGYYEPGHYCLVVVDGRQADYSRGMYLEELSQLFADLGCAAAYNLDGGHCSFMTKDASVISQP
ncbi:MAG: phosphodiester glycosidase family protein, partial [Lachnospiraceae bacterium]|nr:phosphodiester glycosidase family protein [Lachnospiraceae bacterium]